MKLALLTLSLLSAALVSALPVRKEAQDDGDSLLKAILTLMLQQAEEFTEAIESSESSKSSESKSEESTDKSSETESKETESKEESEEESKEHRKEKLTEAIHNMEKKYTDAFNAKDWQALAELYTDDAVYMAPHTPTIDNKKDLVTNLYAAPENTSVEAVRLSFYSAHIIDAGEYAIGFGEWTFTVASQKDPVDQGRFLTAYRKVGGQWLIVADIINTGPASDLKAINVLNPEYDDKQKHAPHKQNRVRKLLSLLLKRRLPPAGK